MPNYMDDLFSKIKDKKKGISPKTEKPKEEFSKKEIAPETKKELKKPLSKDPIKETIPQEAKKQISKEAPLKKIAPKGKVIDIEKIIQKKPIEPIINEKTETPPENIPPVKKEIEIKETKTPEPIAIKQKKSVHEDETESLKSRSQKSEEQINKEVSEAEKKIEEMKKELPPQEKVIPESVETVPDEVKTQTEKKLEKAKKQLIAEYGTTKIYKIPNEPLLFYWTPVPRPVGAEKTIINTIKEAATRIISITPYKIRDQEQKRNVYYQKILEILRDSPEMNIPKTRYEFYADTVVREMVGYGIIDNLIKDDKLEEIMVIGPKLPVFVFHRDYEMMVTNIEFYSDNEIQDLINRIARQIGRRVDLSSPLLDARLPDGSRVNATVPPSSVQGSTLTIRKFREEPYTIVDLINYGTINVEAAAFLWLCMEGLATRPANILIAGGTGSGKTTTLNVLASLIPETERIITIEDTAELNLPLKHWIRMEARPPGLEGTGELTMDILTKNSLRMRPDRIIVGEIRHDEAFSLFTAFNTGHDGSLGTVHANSAEEAIVRVTSPPMNVPKVMMSGLNFIIIQHRLHDKKSGTIRRITEIAEVTGVLKGETKTQAIFKRDAKSDSLKRTKTQIKYLELLQEMTGVSAKEIEEELKKREMFLKKLTQKKGIKMKEITKNLKEYLMQKS